MTTRERWTVYPLLFLAIGLAMRAQSGAPDLDGRIRVEVLDAASVICRELRVESADGPTLVHLGRVKGGGGGSEEEEDDSTLANLKAYLASSSEEEEAEAEEEEEAGGAGVEGKGGGWRLK